MRDVLLAFLTTKSVRRVASDHTPPVFQDSGEYECADFTTVFAVSRLEWLPMYNVQKFARIFSRFA